MAELGKQYKRDRWKGAYSETFFIPKCDSEETEQKKAAILKDDTLNESEKWYRLAQLCLNTKETFYVPTMSGCYMFQYYPEKVCCRIRYAYLTPDKNILPQDQFPKIEEVLQLRSAEFNTAIPHSNQNVYRFGLNTHMQAPAVTMKENGELNVSPAELMHEYVDFAPDPIVTTDITDIPYDSLQVFGNPDKVEGVRGLRETAHLLDGFEYSMRQQEFIKHCKGFYATSHYYQPAMALMNTMMMQAQFNVMKNNYYAIQKIKEENPDISNEAAVQKAKDLQWYAFICPDELCIHSDEEFVIDEWKSRDLGISKPYSPELDKARGIDDESAKRYISEAIFINKAIQEFWYQKSNNNRWYCAAKKSPEAQKWIQRSRSMWTMGNMQKMNADSMKALEERVINEKKYTSINTQLNRPVQKKQKENRSLFKKIMDHVL